MFSTDFIFRQQEKLDDNQKSGFMAAMQQNTIVFIVVVIYHAFLNGNKIFLLSKDEIS